MEAINKNQQEIEKILKEINWYKENNCEDCEFDIVEKSKLQERIKTSILWCEDEIAFLDKCRKLSSIYEKEHYETMTNEIIELRNHLNRLKSKEELTNEN